MLNNKFKNNELFKPFTLRQEEDKLVISLKDSSLKSGRAGPFNPLAVKALIELGDMFSSMTNGIEITFYPKKGGSFVEAQVVGKRVLALFNEAGYRRDVPVLAGQDDAESRLEITVLAGASPL